MSFANDAYRKIKENEKLRFTRGQLFQTPELRGKVKKRNVKPVLKMTPHEKRKVEQLMKNSNADNRMLKRKSIIITFIISIAIVTMIIFLFKWAFLS
jgi:hypothetical protein